MTRDEVILRWLARSRSPTRRELLRWGGLGGLSLVGCGAVSNQATPITGHPVGGDTTGTGTTGRQSLAAGTVGSGSASGAGTTTGGTIPVDAGIPVPCSPQPCPSDGNTLILPLKDYPALMPVGGSQTFFDRRYVDPVCSNDNVIVVQPTAGTFVSFSASCTHQCCEVFFQDALFKCPCHGSEFDLSGNVVQGPATQALPTIPTCFDGCTIFVQLAG